MNKTQKNNPFGLSGVYRYYLAFGSISKCERMLDVGCGDGRFISKVDQVEGRYGCDPSLKAISLAREKYKNIDFKVINQGDKLPYKSSYFDLVTALEVLEHVADRKAFIEELYRVLKPGGKLILTTPHAGLTGWFDVGNLKFRFPGVHRAIVEFVKGKDYYMDVYMGSMCGDMSKGLTEHHHFTAEEIKRLLKGKFRVENLLAYGLFVPFVLLVKDFLKAVLGKEPKFIKNLVMLDAKLFTGKVGYSIFVEAIKK